jgi:glycosyltransferase involved in cell wall biosynthesis
MKRNGQLLISVSMICRNEAARLERAVASARTFADEVIVADTGSDDGTPELAVKLGCKLVKHPWSHNFAAARNASLAACRGAFVFWVDPDETIPPEDAPELRRLAAEGTFDEIRCPTYLNSTYRPAEQDLPGYGPGFIVLKPRMFRRCQQVRWQFRVHEDLHWSRAISRCDSGVRVLNHGDANHHGATGEDYYHALMVVGLREDPGQPHYALYLSEYALVGAHDTERAQAYLDACDPKRLGGEEQIEKYWLLVGRTHKARALMAAERRDQPGATAAAEKAMEAYQKAHNILGRSRAPLEAATLVLYGGQRERFDELVAAVRKADPGNLQALYLERLSALEADAAQLNIMVGTWLMAQRGQDPELAFAAVVGAGGKASEPVRVRVVVPARLTEATPLRIRNLGVCLGRLKAARRGLPEGVTVEVVLVEQAGGEPLVQMASEADAEYAFVDDPGPFNRSACLNAGANWTPDMDLDPDDDQVLESEYPGPDLLCLLDPAVPGLHRRVAQGRRLEGRHAALCSCLLPRRRDQRQGLRRVRTGPGVAQPAGSWHAVCVGRRGAVDRRRALCPRRGL